jgi:hypothetical protein
MTSVGIIANPASGKDIRRLVAHGSVFDNEEKVSIVRRVLLGLDAAGIERVWIMPDSFGIGIKALDGLQLRLATKILTLPLTFSQDDTTLAAARMTAAGAGCLVTLGGDGTNRAVARAGVDVPLLPISTGTNNVFPTMIEGTIAGLAAGIVARGLADVAVRTVPRIDVVRSGSEADLALVDAAVYDERFVGSRAIWDPARVREIVLTGAEPGTIGLSSIGAHLAGTACPAGHGLYLRLGPEGRLVLAPIAPGLIATVGVVDWRVLAPGDEILVEPPRACVLALDGEREIELPAGTPARLRFNPSGPRVVDTRRAIDLAARAGVFVTPPRHPDGTRPLP